ncbi:DUF6660 family protein [Mucilaginibacter paludis]|uniref:Uncharacterized protein n=1 Tax=Mucilaginibacter paludis DSM 18603 TaxID=714943 RepID=H1YD34_9SPHI|nr:DUF6660 family protein [Mucilaginibacter paludis]EHQ26091.1 hypothetical protein Mucpa_1945 [Mucilaginibacter paludis DSM 18603]
MKYLAIIISLYMTLLSLLPCQDSEDMMAGVTQVTVRQVTVRQNRECNQHESRESCPPFCTCACCSTVRHVSSPCVISLPIITLISVYPAYRIPAVLKQPIAIWQPPQIA